MLEQISFQPVTDHIYTAIFKVTTYSERYNIVEIILSYFVIGNQKLKVAPLPFSLLLPHILPP
jgi:hypothetical protein